MEKLTGSDLAEALARSSRGFVVRGVEDFGEGKVLIKARWKGEVMVFEATIGRVVEGRLPSRVAAAPDGREYTEEEAKRLGLPLYHSKEWLRGALKRYGSVTGIVKATGYTHKVVTLAVVRHGLQGESPRLAQVAKWKAMKEKAEAEWLAGSTPKDIAKAYGVSERTVYGWIKPLKDSVK